MVLPGDLPILDRQKAAILIEQKKSPESTWLDEGCGAAISSRESIMRVVRKPENLLREGITNRETTLSEVMGRRSFLNRARGAAHTERANKQPGTSTFANGRGMLDPPPSSSRRAPRATSPP